MALKADRVYNEGVDISFFMNTTGERGGIVVVQTGGSGIAMDDAGAVVAYPTGQAPSGTKPAGLLLNDMVNVDLTRMHVNQHKDEMQVGSKCTLLRRGWVVTNVIDTGDTPAILDDAYYNSAGELTSTDPGTGPVVGKFLSTKDADGYAKVEISLG
jgi:hypothetical protein